MFQCHYLKIDQEQKESLQDQILVEYKYQILPDKTNNIAYSKKSQ